MNLQHLSAFVWLRWRLLANQLTRGGRANQVVLVIVAASFILGTVTAFALAIPIGYFLLSEATPLVMMLVWDGIVSAFLLFWMVGLLTELQRSETLSLEKFLHLPVSLWGVFALNYLSSLFSLTLMLIAPAMLGLVLGLIGARGMEMPLLLPLVGSFLFMVTATTYQFQGWLASLMQDKRRRRTIIVVVTLIFILVFQLPNLINVLRPWELARDDERIEKFKKDREKLDLALKTKELDAAEHARQRAELEQQRADYRTTQIVEQWRFVEQIAWPVNAALPVFWLPLGAYGILEGNALPAILGTLGMTLLGGASFWRAYRTTVRLHMGGFSAGVKQPAAAAPVTPAAEPRAASAGMVAWRLPWISDQAAVIALAGLRSLTRAPETKMLLLTPVIMVVIFGGVFWRGDVDMPAAGRPLLGFGGISMILLSLSQIIGNQFGFDRGGFRVYVLSPAPRREILLGKNLSTLPITLALASLAIVFVQVVQPMRIDHILAMLPLFLSMYLLYCLLANLLSIFAPMAIASGTMKAANTRLVPIVLHMTFVGVLPIAFAPTLIPLGVEAGLEALGWIEGVPICLLLSLVECAAIVCFYRLALTWEGRLLQRWEQRVLEIVTTKAE